MFHNGSFQLDLVQFITMLDICTIPWNHVNGPKYIRFNDVVILMYSLGVILGEGAPLETYSRS